MKKYRLREQIESFENVLCPICDSSDFHKLFDIPPRTIVECDKCGHEYVNPLPIFKCKDNYFFPSFEKDALATKIDLTYITRILRKYQLLNCRLLDLGCGQGRIAKGLIQTGLNPENLYLMDRSESSINIIKKMNEPVNIIKKDLDDGIEFTNYFDCIVMVELFEHLIHPKKSLEIILNALKKGGLLVIRSIPNNKSFESFLGKEKWKMRNFEMHYSFFNPETFCRFAEQFSNLEVLEFGCFLQEGYHFYDIIKISRNIGVIKKSIGNDQHEKYNGGLISTSKLTNLLLKKIRRENIIDYYYNDRLPKHQIKNLSSRKDVEKFFNKINLDYFLSPDFSVVARKI